jgi:hypothetical protein
VLLERLTVVSFAKSQQMQESLFYLSIRTRRRSWRQSRKVLTDPSWHVPNDEGGDLSDLQDDGFGPFRGEIRHIFGTRRFIYKRIVSDVIDGNLDSCTFGNIVRL